MKNIYGLVLILLFASFESKAKLVNEYPVVKQVCFDEIETKRSACEQLINQLSKQESIDSKLKLGTSYIYLMFKAKDKKQRDSFKLKAVETYQKVLELEPNNIQGLLGLSLNKSLKEKKVIYRKVLTIDPQHFTTIKALSKLLSMGTDEHKKENLRILKNSYTKLTGQHKWLIAADLFKLLKDKEPTEAKNWKQKVLKDMGLTNTPSNIEFALANLSSVCNVTTFELGETIMCLNYLRAIHQGDKSIFVIHQGDVISAINELLKRKYQLQQQIFDIQIELRDMVEDLKLIDFEKTIDFYLVYAQLTSGSRKYQALIKAQELEAQHPAKATIALIEHLVNEQKNTEALKFIELLIDKGHSPYKHIAASYKDKILNW